MRLRSKLLIGAVLAGISLPVLADVNYTQGAGTVIFAFTCFTTKVCPAHVNTNSSGVEIMTTANPGQIDESASSQFHTDLTTINTSLGTLNTTAGNPLAAGTNTIGSVKRTDGTNIVLTDPCQGVAKTYTPINISASGSVKIITGTAAKKTYVCHIDIVTNAANNVLLSEGTGTNCATGTQGIIGGTTAASGWNFSANGGISLGMGGYAVLQAWNATGDDVCLNPSAATQLSGMVAWVQQ